MKALHFTICEWCCIKGKTNFVIDLSRERRKKGFSSLWKSINFRRTDYFHWKIHMVLMTAVLMKSERGKSQQKSSEACAESSLNKTSSCESLKKPRELFSFALEVRESTSDKSPSWWFRLARYFCMCIIDWVCHKFFGSKTRQLKKFAVKVEFEVSAIFLSFLLLFQSISLVHNLAHFLIALFPAFRVCVGNIVCEENSTRESWALACII